MKIVASRTDSVFRDADFELTEEDFEILRSRTNASYHEQKPYVMAKLAYQLELISSADPEHFEGADHLHQDPWNLTLDWLDANYPNWRDRSMQCKGVA